MAEDPKRTRLSVLFLDNSSTFGGAIISLAHLAKGLPAAGITPVIVSPQPAEVLERLFPGAATISFQIRLPWHRSRLARALLGRRLRPPIVGRAVGAMDALWRITRHTLPEALRYVRIGRRHSVAAIHLNNSVESQLAGVIAASLLRVPCVAHARCFQTFSHTVRAYARHVDRHIAISGAVHDNLVENGVPPSRISVVHDAVDIEAVPDPSDAGPASRKELGIPEHAVAVGIFGRVVAWKGVREFVRAAAEAMRADPAILAFVVGDWSDGEPGYYEECRQIAEASGLGDRFRFTGYRSDVMEVMAAMDLVVHASTIPEPFGMVVIEAMALRKPVVATRGGGPVEIVIDGETGLLVPMRDVAALRDAIVTLSGDSALRSRMGGRGRRRAREQFTKERYAGEVSDVYRLAGVGA